jgi:transcriptional regulator with XRE-family HTH domain
MAKKRTLEAPGLVEQLRELVRSSGQTLIKLADLTGVDPSRLSRFLNARRGLSQEALDRIVRALNIRLVRGDAPPATPPPAPPVEPPSPATKKPGRRKKEQP